jgi:hypothetical protein
MPWIKTEVKLPKQFDEDDAKAIGEELINFIVERTKKGKGSDGASFPKYSDVYKKSFEFTAAGKGNTVNLTLSGEMLDSLKVLEASQGKVVIGFDKDDEVNDRAEGNILGSYGGDPDKEKARDFMALSQNEVDKIIKSLAIETEEDQTILRNKPSEIRSRATKLATELMSDIDAEFRAFNTATDFAGDDL